MNEELRNETEEWLRKAEEKRKMIKLSDDSKKELVKNIDAYILDARHFLAKNDLIRSFEAVIWAWAWIEILERLGIIKSRAKT